MASQSNQPDAKRVTEFMRLLHAFQSVERVMYSPDLKRQENDVEHSYTLTMLCWYLVETFCLDLNRQKILEYGLIHDLVEVYAGDTFIFDSEAQKSKHEREEQARLKIAKEFPEFQSMHDRIAEYEAGNDPEAIFVREADKLIPLITNYIQGGIVWKKVNVQPEVLFANKRDKITKREEIRHLLEQFIAELDSRRSDFFNRKC